MSATPTRSAPNIIELANKINANPEKRLMEIEVDKPSIWAPSSPPKLQGTQRGIASIKGKERALPSNSSVHTYETTDDEEEVQ
jgi:hypothetical protein